MKYTSIHDLKKLKKYVQLSDYYIRGPLFWSSETSLPPFPESDDPVSVSTPRCREELEDVRATMCWQREGPNVCLIDNIKG